LKQKNIRKSIKGSVDSDSRLVSSENFSKILWPSGWALSQESWAKMIQNYFTYGITHKKYVTPNQKDFFKCRLEDWPIRLIHWTAF